MVSPPAHPDKPESEFWRRRRLIRESNLSAQQKLLLYIVADYAGDSGECYVGRTRLAADLSLSVRQVRYLIQSAERAGVVAVDVRGGRTNLYRIQWEGVQSVAGVQCTARVQPIAGEGCNPLHGGGAVDCTGGVQPIAPKHKENTQLTPKRTPKRARTRFVKPTVEEVKAFCSERKNAVDAERFHAYYESNGWRVGRSPMTDWRAAIKTWERNGYDDRRNGTADPTKVRGTDKSFANIPVVRLA